MTSNRSTVAAHDKETKKLNDSIAEKDSFREKLEKEIKSLKDELNENIAKADVAKKSYDEDVLEIRSR